MQRHVRLSRGTRGRDVRVVTRRVGRFDPLRGARRQKGEGGEEREFPAAPRARDAQC